jgi:hypothetical protein
VSRPLGVFACAGGILAARLAASEGGLAVAPVPTIAAALETVVSLRARKVERGEA